MTDDASKEPPAWWVVDRRAQREAERQARRQERADRRESRRKERRGEPAREPLTPARIADAALRIVDGAGVDGLTVRALAQELGVGTMTLYWYVRDKDEILDVVADRLLEGVAPPSYQGDWRDQVRGLAMAVRRALLEHARAVPIIVSRGSFGPNGLLLLEASIGALRTAGFGVEDAADAYSAISSFVTGFCVSETSGPGPSTDTGPNSSGAAERAMRFASLVPADRFPNVASAAPHLFGGGNDERFSFGLDCLIDGLARRLPAGPA